MPSPKTFEELFEYLLPHLMSAGVTIFEFWDYTLSEMNTIIEVYNKNEINRVKEIAINNHILGDLIGASVGRLINKKAKYPALYEVYPNLFEKPKTSVENWEIGKARLMEFAANRNRQLADKKNKVKDE